MLKSIAIIAFATTIASAPSKAHAAVRRKAPAGKVIPKEKDKEHIDTDAVAGETITNVN